MDRLTKEQRKKNMQAVKSKGSKIEIKLTNAISKLIRKKGYKYQKNYNKVIGTPDIVILSLKIAIFCDSEFWHGKNWKKKKFEIKSNKAFWIKKIEGNIKRDKRVNKLLKQLGWIVLRFWGKEIDKNIGKCIIKIENTIKRREMEKYSILKRNLNLDHSKYKNSEHPAFITHYFQNNKIDYYENYSVKYFQSNKISPDFIRDGRLPELLPYKWDIPFPPIENPQFTFIDLFAGIGGFRLAFQNLKGKCLFSSEIDYYAKKTYEANFGKYPFGDITKINAKDIPDHDILLAGFPCQAFSIAGRRKGFEDTRGTLFFDIARILKEKKPKAFFLENVKGLRNHQQGKTLKTILNVLRNDLNYYVPDPQIINAKNFGVPQNRERIFIIGFRGDLNINNFSYPHPSRKKPKIADITEKNTVSSKYYLSTQYLKTLRRHKRRHAAKGNGFGYEIIPNDGISNAIVVGGMGRERNLIIDNKLIDYTPVTHIKGVVNREGIRRMTPREWARLQGLPDKFKIIVSDAQAYKQFGNSVAFPAIQATGREIIKILEEKNVIRK